MFPPHGWSCFERVLKDLPRTSCAAEAFHAGFNSRIEQRPFFGRFIRFVQKELRTSQQRICGIITGGQHKRCATNLLRDKAIKEVVATFGHITLEHYLTGCATVLQSFAR
jgi:hypothetical protein